MLFFNRRGITLIEILMVISLVTLLVTLAIPSYGWLRDRAGFAGCVSNLRIIHVGFNNYMQDHDMVWPQIPGGVTGFPDESDEWKWWYESLKDYGVGRTHWVCPSDDDATATPDPKDKDAPEYSSSYIPTAFDEFPNSAFRWKQPWVIERGGFHYKDRGPNLLMPDGTIQQGPVIPSVP